MKNQKIVSVLAAVVFLSNSMALAQNDCARNTKRFELQAQYSAEMEEVFKADYEGAAATNRLSTMIFIPSALVLSLLGGYNISAALSGNLTAGAIIGAPALFAGIALTQMTGVTAPFILGWAVQLTPAVYALGHGAYRLVHQDQIVDLTAEQLKENLAQLENLEKENLAKRAQILEGATYSQFKDGLMLGALDRKLTFDLYQTAVTATQIAKAKFQLSKLVCE